MIQNQQQFSSQLLPQVFKTFFWVLFFLWCRFGLRLRYIKD
ncbi:MAG: hypothetical protein ABIJ80_00930 [Patescibacteria group bacterium]